MRELPSSDHLCCASRVGQGATRMAVPFRACDTPSERAEFKHPDAAIVKTQLAYYHAGLQPAQLRDALHAALSLPVLQGEQVFRCASTCHDGPCSRPCVTATYCHCALCSLHCSTMSVMACFCTYCRALIHVHGGRLRDQELCLGLGSAWRRRNPCWVTMFSTRATRRCDRAGLLWSRASGNYSVLET